ncbi:hypothetical protein KAI87_10865 [Myxococcota bacterium]|nr:hypothetical protein [Myxococcota bacterium]
MNGIATPRKKSVTNSNQLLKDLDQRIYGERDKFEMVFECPAWVAKPSDSRRDLVKMGRIELEAKLRSKWAHNFETYRGVERGGKALSENGEFQIQSRLEDYDRVMPLIAKDWDRFTQLVAKSVNPDRRKDNIGAILTHKESPSALYSYMVNIVGNAPLNQLIANSKRPAYFRQEVVFKAYWSFSDFDKVTRNSK